MKFKSVWLIFAAIFMILLSCSSPTESSKPGTIELLLTENALYMTGDTVTIGVRISQPTKEDYSSIKLFANTQLLATLPAGATSFEYKWVTTNVEAADYSISLKASGTSLDDNPQKTVKISLAKFKMTFKTPADSSEFFTGRELPIEMNLESKNFALNRLEYYIDATPLGTHNLADGATGDVFKITPSNTGTHNIVVKAVSSKGKEIEANRSVKFSNYGIMFDIPNYSQHWKGASIDLPVTVVDQSKKLGKTRQVTSVNYLIDGVLAGSDNSLPFSYTWNTSPTAITTGDHQIIATGISAYGLEFSDTIKVLLSTASLDISSPVSGLEYLTDPTEPPTVPITAILTEQNLQLSHINIYVDNVLKDSLSQAPYIYNWKPAMSDIGMHSVKVEAVSNHGLKLEKTSSNIKISYYKIDILNANNSQHLKGETIPITASIIDNSKSKSREHKNITKVDFYVDNVLAYTDDAAPFVFDWNTSSTAVTAKNYTIKTVATSNMNKTLEDQVTIILSSADFNITNPVSGQEYLTHPTAPQPIVISAALTQTNFQLSHVNIYIDNILKDSLAQAPFTYSWTPQMSDIGLHSVKVEAVSIYGLKKTKVCDNVKISYYGIDIVNPNNSQHFKGETIPITASIIDNSKKLNKSITKVDFYVDNVLAYTDEVAPFVFDWNTSPTAVTAKNYTIKAIATSNLGKAIEDQVTIILSSAEFNITNPVSGQEYLTHPTAPQPIVISAALTQTNFQLSHVNIYIDNILKDSLAQAPFTYSWTPQMSDIGLHSVKVEAVSIYGLKETKVCDNVKISYYGVDITNPNNSQHFKGETIPITASIVDNSKKSNRNITKVDFYVDNVLAFTDDTAPFVFDWNTTPTAVTAKNYTIKAVATSNLGKTLEDQVTIILSTASLNITNPLASKEYLLSSTMDVLNIPVSASLAEQNFQLNHVKIYVDNIMKDSLKTAPFTYVWHPGFADIGAHTVKVVAVSNQGKEVSLTVGNVKISFYSINIDNPNNTQYFKGETIPVTVSMVDNSKGRPGSAKGVTKVDFYVDGIFVYSDATAPFTFDWNTGTYAATNHVVKAIATSDFNNVIDDQVTFIVTDAQLAISNPVSGHEYLTKPVAPQSIPVTAALSGSNFQLSRVDVYIDNVLKTSLTQAPFVYNWTPQMSDIGNHVIKVEAVSLYNRKIEKLCENVKISHYDINIDNSDNTQYFKGETVPITLTMIDNSKKIVGSAKSITKVDFYVDGVFSYSDMAAPYAFDWSTTNVTAANHIIKAVATSNFDNVLEDQVTVVITDEQVNITSLQDGHWYLVEDPIALTCALSGSNFGISNVKIYVDNELKTTLTSQPYNYNWTPSVEQVGNHTFKAVATSTYGRTVEASKQFTVKKMELNITSPASGSTHMRTDQITITAEAPVAKYTGSGIEKIGFYLGDRLIAEDNAAPYTCTLNTDTLYPGARTVTAKVKVTGGPEYSKSIPITIRDIVFSTTFGDGSADNVPKFVYQMALDESYLMGTSNGNVMTIQKFDKKGVITTTNQSSLPGVITGIDPTNVVLAGMPGGYIVTGYVTEYKNSNHNLPGQNNPDLISTSYKKLTWVVKLNSSLGVEWNTLKMKKAKLDASYNKLPFPNDSVNILDSKFRDSDPIAIKQNADNGFLVLCNTTDSASTTNSNTKPRLIKLLSTGNVGDNGDIIYSKNAVFNSLEVLTNYSCRAAGYINTPDKGKQMYVVDCGPTNVSNEHIYGGTGEDVGYGLTSPVVVGSTQAASGNDTWIVDFSQSGNNPTWDFTSQDFTASDETHAVDKTWDNAYIAAGKSDNDLYLVKFKNSVKGSKSGYVVDGLPKKYSNPTDPSTTNSNTVSSADFVKRLNYGGYLVVGWTKEDASAKKKTWVLKLDAKGNYSQAAKKRK